MASITITPLMGIASVQPGDDLAAIVVQALQQNQCAVKSGDVLVVAQKIVSKAEGRYRRLSSVEPSVEATELAQQTRKDPRLVQLVLNESVGVVRASLGVLIVRDHNGLVMANAGIDASNLEGDADQVLLLPENADVSAARLRQELFVRLGVKPAVIIADSFGRPWRNGVTNVAIGAAGLPALLDKRTQPDRAGRPLQVTQVAIADLLAGAAGLVLGEGDEGIPVALVSGLPSAYVGTEAEHCPASSLVRPLEQDLFR